MESYEKAEKRFFENLKLKEERFQIEKDLWQGKLDEAVKDDKAKYQQLFLTMTMMKWRFMVAVIKLKAGQGSQDVEEVLTRIMDT